MKVWREKNSKRDLFVLKLSSPLFILLRYVWMEMKTEETTPTVQISGWWKD